MCPKYSSRILEFGVKQEQITNKKLNQESKTEKVDLQVALLVLVDPAGLWLLHHQHPPFAIKGKHEVNFLL